MVIGSFPGSGSLQGFTLFNDVNFGTSVRVRGLKRSTTHLRIWATRTNSMSIDGGLCVDYIRNTRMLLPEVAQEECSGEFLS